MSVMCFCYIQVTVRSICFRVNNYLVIFDLCLTTLTAVHLDVKLFSLLHSKKIFNSFKFAITHKYNWWLFKKYIYIWFTTSLPASIFAVLFFLVVQKWQGHILSSYWDRKYRHKLTNLLQNLYCIFLVHNAANGIFFSSSRWSEDQRSGLRFIFQKNKCLALWLKSNCNMRGTNWGFAATTPDLSQRLFIFSCFTVSVLLPVKLTSWVLGCLHSKF